MSGVTRFGAAWPCPELNACFSGSLILECREVRDGLVKKKLVRISFKNNISHLLYLVDLESKCCGAEHRLLIGFDGFQSN